MRDAGELDSWEYIIHELCDFLPAVVAETKRTCTYTQVALAHRFKMVGTNGVGYKIPKNG